MPDPRQNVRPGQKLQIAAEQINFLNGLMRQGGGFGSAGLTGWAAGTNVILCRNDSVGDVPQFGVLELTRVVIDPAAGNTAERQFSEMPCLVGEAPDIAEPADAPVARPQKICVTLEPIAAGKIGRVVVAGPVQVKLDVIDEEHRFARAQDGTTDKLETCEESDAPAKILWKSDASGDKWALVALNDCGQRFFLGKTQSSDWPPFTKQSVDRYDDGKDAGAVGGTVEDVYNLFSPIAPESWVVIWNAPDGQWYVTTAGKWQAGCHPTVIAGHDLAQVPDYDATKTQVLIHEQGCLKWLDTTECSQGGTQ